jgi:hypothetical protein
MNTPHTQAVQHPLGRRAPDSTSDVPTARPPTSVEEAVPHPAADAGGLDDIPLDLLPEHERVEVELDQAGLDAEWPANLGEGPEALGHEACQPGVRHAQRQGH